MPKYTHISFGPAGHKVRLHLTYLASAKTQTALAMSDARCDGGYTVRVDRLGRRVEFGHWALVRVPATAF